MGEDRQSLQQEPYVSAFKFPPAAAALSPEHISGMATPPLHALASVPFKWEEQPGKPRPCTDIIVARGLELPPCRAAAAAAAAKMTRMPSPTTVLDGPYNHLGRPRFSSFRMFRDKQSSFDSSSSGGSPRMDALVGNKKNKKKQQLKMSRLFKSRSLRADEGSLGFSPSSSFDGDFVEGKMRKGFSPPPPPLWISMYESLKQAIAWKRTRKSKKGGAR